MIRYDATVHTVEAFIEQYAGIRQAAPDALFVGSVGRAILYDELLGDACHELNARGQQILTNGFKARDIDLITDAQPDTLPQAPFYTDTQALNNSFASFARDGDDWVLTSEQRNFSERLHPAVMEPVQGTGLFGLEGQTVPLQTHIAIYSTRGQLRRTDDIPFRLLQTARKDTRSELPDEFYEPFAKLAALKMGRMRALKKLVYRRLLPSPIEMRIDEYLSR